LQYLLRLHVAAINITKKKKTNFFNGSISK
jgi:hypothetical protein